MAVKYFVVMDLWSCLFTMRPGYDTETISTQVGKVKKQILQVKATKVVFKCLYSAGISLFKK